MKYNTLSEYMEFRGYDPAFAETVATCRHDFQPGHELEYIVDRYEKFVETMPNKSTVADICKKCRINKNTYFRLCKEHLEAN